MPDTHALTVPSTPQEVMTLTAKATALKIETPAGRGEAVDLLARVRTARKTVEKRMKDECAPLTQQIKDIKDRANVSLTMYGKGEDVLVTGILLYDERVAAEAQAEQARLSTAHAKKVEKAIAKSESTGAPLKIPAAPAIVQTPPKSTVTTSGQTVTRVALPPTWDIPGVIEGGKPVPGADLSTTNPLLADIPRRHFILDIKGITGIIEHDGEVAGVTARKQHTLSVK